MTTSSRLMRLYVRFIASLSVALLFQIVILFTIPPSTTLGIIFKDVLSLLICAILYFKILKR
ncbi:hypothetical protein [uncultured Duncaniella sp.]|uniref:hypothetical protein n=1 Tax=uncultured Duncaniella sp. TaxID=2768039 RepID=UPI0026763414|nr:hypothetical protein [uncultured Duncaniella sp.]